MLGAATFVMAWRGAPHRANARRADRRAATNLTRAARNSSLPVAEALGVHFALESGRGRSEVPVRSVIVGAVVAVTLMVTTLTFSSGLAADLHSALYGCDWSYTLTPTNAAPPAMLAMLRRDPLVAAWSGAGYTDAEIDGQTVPFILMDPGSRVEPPLISGHQARNDHQLVLGAATLALLHKRVGDTVYVSYGSKAGAPAYIAPTPETVVGTATFPAIGYSSYIAEHTAMGIGALVPTGCTPRPSSPPSAAPTPTSTAPRSCSCACARGEPRRGLRQHGAPGARRRRGLRRGPARARQRGHGVGSAATGPDRQRRSIGSTPELLAAGLAVGAVLGLALTLLASVRRRRRDLALLKTLGLSRRQAARATIAWQASVDGAIGAIVGVPLGVVLGRELWTLFARSINAVPDPTVPTWPVVLVGVGSLVVANLAAALPGRSAARTAPGLVLRSE